MNKIIFSILFTAVFVNAQEKAPDLSPVSSKVILKSEISQLPKDVKMSMDNKLALNALNFSVSRNFNNYGFKEKYQAESASKEVESAFKTGGYKIDNVSFYKDYQDQWAATIEYSCSQSNFPQEVKWYYYTFSSYHQSYGPNNYYDIERDGKVKVSELSKLGYVILKQIISMDTYNKRHVYEIAYIPPCGRWAEPFKSFSHYRNSQTMPYGQNDYYSIDSDVKRIADKFISAGYMILEKLRTWQFESFNYYIRYSAGLDTICNDVETYDVVTDYRNRPYDNYSKYKAESDGQEVMRKLESAGYVSVFSRMGMRNNNYIFTILYIARAGKYSAKPYVKYVWLDYRNKPYVSQYSAEADLNIFISDLEKSGYIMIERKLLEKNNGEYGFSVAYVSSVK